MKKEVTQDSLPFISSEKFMGEKEGYVFFHDKVLGNGYHCDKYPKNPIFELTSVVSTAKLRQNDRGKFDPQYEYISIGELADPQHRCRNFGKEIVALAKAPLRDSLITDEIAARIIKAFKYWYRQARENTFEEIKRTRLVSLNHLTGDHSLCSDQWCYALKARNIGKKYQEPETTLCPEYYAREILQVLEILNRYTSDERIKEMMHFFDTQICEAINNALTFCAPKNKNFSRTRSLEYRKCHVIGTHNDGHSHFYSKILDGLGIENTKNIEELFSQLTQFKTNRKLKQASFETKRIRAHGYAAAQKAEISKQRIEGTSYSMNLQMSKVVDRGQRKKT